MTKQLVSLLRHIYYQKSSATITLTASNHAAIESIESTVAVLLLTMVVSTWEQTCRVRHEC